MFLLYRRRKNRENAENGTGAVSVQMESKPTPAVLTESKKETPATAPKKEQNIQQIPDSIGRQVPLATSTGSTASNLTTSQSTTTNKTTTPTTTNNGKEEEEKSKLTNQQEALLASFPRNSKPASTEYGQFAG